MAELQRTALSQRGTAPTRRAQFPGLELVADCSSVPAAAGRVPSLGP